MNEETQNQTAQPPKHTIKGYVDTTGVMSNRALTFSEWYIKHKLVLHKTILAILIVSNIVLWGYSLYGWGRYFFFDYTNTDRTLALLASPPPRFPQVAPRSVQLSDIQVFQNSRDTYDFIVNLSNPNKNWRGKVTYNFTYAGGTSPSVTAEFLPGGNQILAVFGVEASSYPTNVSVNIEKVEWQRISSHIVSDPLDFLETRVNFSAENVVFVPANQRDGVITHAISFDILNNSVYGYWLPRFDVIFLNNQSPVGVQRIEVEEFRPGDIKNIELRSFAPQLRVTEIKLIPHIDVFDETEYIAPGD